MSFYHNRQYFNRDKFIKHFNAKLVDPNFSYNSGDNEEWETIESLRELLKNSC